MKVTGGIGKRHAYVAVIGSRRSALIGYSFNPSTLAKAPLTVKRIQRLRFANVGPVYAVVVA